MRMKTSGRRAWLVWTAVLAVVCALLRRWQMATAFEGELSLPIPRATATVVLTCVLVMGCAVLVLLAVYQQVVRPPRASERGRRWDMCFFAPGDRVFLGAMIVACFLALAAVPVLFSKGGGLWRLYRASLAAGIWAGGDNGVLTMVTALLALLAALGLFLTGRDGYRAGRRGQGGFAAALPAATGCAWLMRNYRSHAADPVLWDYVPLLLAIIAGMLMYMDWAGLSCTAARPRRTLWMAGMTVILSAVALATGEELGNALLLLSQMVAALAALWRLPPNLEHPPEPGTPAGRRLAPTPQEIQEENTHE